MKLYGLYIQKKTSFMDTKDLMTFADLIPIMVYFNSFRRRSFFFFFFYYFPFFFLPLLKDILLRCMQSWKRQEHTTYLRYIVYMEIAWLYPIIAPADH
jgi:hypothetical protein